MKTDNSKLEKDESGVYRIPLEIFQQSRSGRLGRFPCSNIDPNKDQIPESPNTTS